MDSVQKNLAQFRLHFDTSKNSNRHQMNSTEKCQNAKNMVENLLLLPDQQLTLNLNACIGNFFHMSII